MKKMDVQINASNEGEHRALKNTNRKRPDGMKEVGIQQNAKRQKTVGSFYIILLFILILLVALRVIMPIVVLVYGMVSKLFF